MIATDFNSTSGTRWHWRTAWSTQLTVLLVASILLLAAMGVWTARSVDTLRVEGEWLVHSERVRLHITRVMQLLTDAETSGRGFALTKDDLFLEPYRQAKPQLPRDVAILRSLVADNITQAGLASELDNLVQLRLSRIEDLIHRTRDKEFDTSHPYTRGLGNATMTAARSVASQMQAEEGRLLDIRHQRSLLAARDVDIARWITGGLSAFLLLFIAFSAARHGVRLRQADRTLVTTLRSVGDAVIATDPAGAVWFMNEVATQMTGWTEDSARGRALTEVFNIVNESSRQRVESPVDKVLREGTIVGLANHTGLIARDGTERPIEDSAAPILDEGKLIGVVLVFRDATSERQSQRLLEESERRFRAAVDAVQGILWTNSAQGEMRGEQPGWAALTGQKADEYAGFGWTRAVHPDDVQGTTEAWLAAVRDSRLFDYEHRVRRVDGQWRRFAVRAVPLLDVHGNTREWVGVHIDVTEQRATESALRDVDARKDVFLATLSHELRNPLAPIRNAALMLGKSGLDAETLERSRAIIVRQVRHMASLLDDLLDVSRITRGVFTLKKDIVQLQSLLMEAAQTVRPLADAKRHTLDTRWPADPIRINADPVRIVQIVTNLLANAVKYTDPEGQITLGADSDREGVTIYVRDTGIGLAPHVLQEVFDMFSQVEPHQERSEGGLGIGLALAKGLVELHGGRIEARSAGLGAGSEFRVYLPGIQVDAGTVPDGADDAAQAATAREQRRVLIADDNRDGAETLAMLLNSAGHTVFVTHTGTDALELAAQQRPDVAVLDIGMPGLNGYEVARRIRSEDWGKHIVLIAVTGWGQVGDKNNAYDAGFNHHLTKPFDADVLADIVAPASSSAG